MLKFEDLLNCIRTFDIIKTVVKLIIIDISHYKAFRFHYFLEFFFTKYKPKKRLMLMIFSSWLPMIYHEMILALHVTYECDLISSWLYLCIFLGLLDEFQWHRKRQWQPRHACPAWNKWTFGESTFSVSEWVWGLTPL